MTDTLNLASTNSAQSLTVSEPPQDSDAQSTNEIKNTATSPAQLSSDPSQQQPLSKRAQKRLAKAAFFQEKKLERRQREKAAKKEKKRQLRERRATGELGEDEEDGLAQPARKKLKRNEDAQPFQARVVVDLGFDDYMTEKEVISLGSQLAFCYSANRRATCPFETLLFTSLNGRLRTRLERENNAGYKRWTGCEWWEEGYEQLWSDDPPEQEQSSAVEEEASSEEKGRRSRCSKESVVYLTADADDELEELKEGETYVLGGIVDRNRHKFLCQKKATAQGIRAARLPIGKYLKEMKTRKVLTVNQVFEILVHWTENRDWEEAIYSVMPKRKFTQQTGKPPATGRARSESVVGADEIVAEADEEKEVDASSEVNSERDRPADRGVE